MKKAFTLIAILFFTIPGFAQVCTTAGFDVCTGSTAIVSDFRNAVQIAGTGAPLTVGAKYKFSNAIPNLNLDAVISIDAMVNATLAGALNPAIDDDGAVNETTIAGSQAALFAPRIAPAVSLSCNNISGYVEFTVKFYTHYTGNILPTTGTEVAVTHLNFLHFDLDGIVIGTNGWLKKISYVKVNASDPVNTAATSTELTEGGNINDWLLTYGSVIERTGIARCAEVIEKSVYNFPQTAISFRMGYDYKAPTGCAAVNIKPTHQFGSSFGCFNLPSGGPLPVSLVNFAAEYHHGSANITWTSLQEHNLSCYEIQRSVDGINFEVAGYVKANNLTSVQQYGFTDDVTTFTVKYIYYRVRIVDVEHSMKLTNTVSVKLADWKSNEMTITPNPSSNNVQIKIKINKAGAGTITVFDAAGKMVLQQKTNLQSGNNSIAVNNITTLKEGYYIVRLLANDEIFSSKLLIWK